MKSIKLRIHLVGTDTDAKQSMANRLQPLLRSLGRTTVVPDLGADAARKIGNEFESHHFFLALENEYMIFEARRVESAQHLIFVDSIIDRYIRSKESLNMDLYYGPRLQVAREGHLYVVTNSCDDTRLDVLKAYDLPTHFGSEPEIVKAAALRVRKIKK